MKILPIKNENITRASQVLADAFKGDPIFQYIFQSTGEYNRHAAWLFSTWVRWSIQNGLAMMTEDGNGVLLARKPGNTEMSFLSFILAGMLPLPFRVGWKIFRRFYFRVVPLLGRKHDEIMGMSAHWYGWMIATAPGHEGLGLRLMNYSAQLADADSLPYYLETATERDAALYSHFGFEIEKKASLPNSELTLYFMVRKPVFKSEEPDKSAMFKIHQPAF